MDDFEAKRQELVDKYKNNPNEVTRDDLDGYMPFYAIKTYMWDTKNWGGTTQIGKFTVSHMYERGQLSNSGKTRTSDTQHKFTITNTETNETFDNGVIVSNTVSNRRTRGGRMKPEDYKL